MKFGDAILLIITSTIILYAIFLFVADFNLIQEKIFNRFDFANYPIFNYLLMENLNTEQYEHLDKNFQKILPKEKILFNNSTDEEIFQKLQTVQKTENLPNSKAVLKVLFPQYFLKVFYLFYLEPVLCLSFQ